MELGFLIPIVGGIPDSFSSIPDSNTQNSGFHKQTFIRFRNPDYLTRASHETTDECVDIELPKSLELQMTPASRTGPGVKEIS